MPPITCPKNKSLSTHVAAMRARERGVIMVITLIALVILMIGGIALVRSFDTSMLLAGNLAFKRDLVNQGERAMAQAIATLSTGALNSEVLRQSDLLGSNYKASMLASNSKNGIPNVLLQDDATFATVGTQPDSTSATGATIRYVIDRQCLAAGPFDPATCVVVTAEGDKGGSNHMKKPVGESRPVYRISVRVSGPRGTQAFLQSTLSF